MAETAGTDMLQKQFNVIPDQGGKHAQSLSQIWEGTERTLKIQQ